MKVSFSLRLLVSALLLVTGTMARSAPSRIVPNLVPKGARSERISDFAAETPLQLSIGLALRNQEELKSLLAEIYDPSSPLYHRYLTADQFAERFGPGKQDYQALIDWAKSKGLSVTATHPNRVLLDVEGPANVIEKALHIQLGVFKHPLEKRTFFAPETDPVIDVNVPVLGISGLDDFILPRPMSLHTTFADAIPYSEPYATGSGPNGTFIGADFRAAYAPGVKLDGAGQSVALFELDGYYPSDVAAYANLAGLSAIPVTDVFVGGATGHAGANNVEVVLDVAMAISMAPGLSQIFVYQGRAGTPNDVLNRMATDNLSRQLSCSWGFGPQVDPVRQQILAQFAAQGQSFFQSSGDNGAWAGPIYPPSDDPYVTVVGGTSLTTTGPGGQWVSESVWPGSGGGFSITNPIPPWQNGVASSANQGSTTMRNIPDVAALADSTIWLVVNNGQHVRVAGTSAGPPLWAGFTALVNQQGAADGQPSIGFLNPALYALGSSPEYRSALHDIVAGSNTNSTSPTRFFATPGYDLCTGWGTPTGSNLISALLAPPDALRISPGGGFSATGRAGGPLLPAAMSLSLTNAGAAPLDWSVSEPPAWLSVSSSSGHLTAGGPAANVGVSFNTASSNLVAGRYTATLRFTNLYNHFAQTRTFELSIVTPPVITLQPADQPVYEGAIATFSIETAANAFIAYQWRFDNGSAGSDLVDGGGILGSQTSTLTISNVSPARVGAYSVILSNAAGVASSSLAHLTIVPSQPILVASPSNQTALPGSTAQFAALAVGSQPLSYQWFKNGTPMTDGGNISGSTSNTLEIRNISAADAGVYSVRATNSPGFTSSTGATLTVPAVTAPGSELATLYSFTGDLDGAQPNALVQTADGRLFGTTQRGGAGNSGTLFQLTSAGVLTTLHGFRGATEGANPRGALAQTPDGFLYGTTFQSGSDGFGTVFRATTNGAVSAVYGFDKPDGILPFAGVTPGWDGNLYGTTYEGGTGLLYGTVYKLSPNGLGTNLHSFSGDADGGFPYAGLTRGNDGNFYGTTYKGGNNGYGTVFRIGTNGVIDTLFSFNNTNGAFPYAGVVQAFDGSFYGATAYGGVFSNGTIFRITSEGVLTTLYSFSGGDDGAHPAATLIEAGDGNLYGSTSDGGVYGKGTIFRISPAGVFRTVTQFDGFNGADPAASLAQGSDGALYGTTQTGGKWNQGTLFRLSSSGAPEIVDQPASQSAFAGETVRLGVIVEGAAPLTFRWFKNLSPLNDGGNLSGAATRVLTLSNVAVADSGSYSVIVSNALGSEISADAVLQVVSSRPTITLQPTNQTVAPGATVAFIVKAAGDLPMSYTWSRNGTNLLNAANISGANTSTLTLTRATEADNGLYSVVVNNPLGSIESAPAELLVIPPSAAGTRLKSLRFFSGGSDGLSPNGLARVADGTLFGTTKSGGTENSGTIFRVDNNGGVSTLSSFSPSKGATPQGPLVQGINGRLYGVTQAGGPQDSGSVFEVDPSTGSSDSIYFFNDGDDGGHPVAGLACANGGLLYGSTTTGGKFGKGNLFVISTQGALSVLHDFTNLQDGSSPAELYAANDGNLYGMTPHGGASSNGNAFKMTATGTLSTLYSFQGGFDGYWPVGSLIQGRDGNFYGVTKFNKISIYTFYGTVFKLTTNGVLTTLYPFNYTDGKYPAAGLVQCADGNFYGTTFQGGADDLGTIFRITPTGAYTTLVQFDGSNDGARPASALVSGWDNSLYGTTTEGGPGGYGTIFKLSFAPKILTAPASQEVAAGGTVSLGVSVFGTLPIFYQWRLNGVPITDGPGISGSSSAVLTLSNLSAESAGNYSLMVSNALGSLTNTGAMLTVVTPPTFQAVAQTNGVLTLSWAAIAGRSYQLQYKADLSAAGWSNLGSPIRATNTLVSTTDPLGANLRRFYRVLLLP